MTHSSIKKGDVGVFLVGTLSRGSPGGCPVITKGLLQEQPLQVHHCWVLTIGLMFALNATIQKGQWFDSSCVHSSKIMNFLIGCAVWAYKGWIGELYPKGTKTAEFLPLYTQRFTTVEGNTTFYAVPDRETVIHWASQMPPGFELCPKLPRQLTHNGLLEPSIAGALEFLNLMQGLGEHLGPIFAQLPPNYTPTSLKDLAAFLKAWSRSEAPLAVEVRHPDWFTEPHASHFNELLQELGVGRVLLDTRPAYKGSATYEQQPVDPRKPKLPVHPVTTASFTLVRFISHPDQNVNQPFMEEWVSWVEQWLQTGKRIYFYMHCPLEKYSPGNARHFQQLLEQRGAPVPPLPWNNVEQPPIQLSLF